MYEAIDIILYVSTIPLGIIFAYLMILALFGLRVKKTHLVNGGNVRYAILIPAHNEEDVIQKLITSINDLNYDHTKLSVLFVADHCTDNTVNILKASGLDYIENTSGKRGKSVALSIGAAVLLGPTYGDWDALSIFDADNIIDPNFFNVVSKRFADDVILQGNTGIFNKTDTIFTKLNHVNFIVTNRFKELARSQAGLTCRLRGHGMVFPRGIFSQLSWESASLVEDQDLLLRLVLDGKKVTWVHDAKVESIIPSNISDAKVQRQRWAGGKSIMLKSAVCRLFYRAFSNKDFVVFDLAMDFLMPSYAVYLAILLLLIIISTIFSGLGGITFFYVSLCVGMMLYYVVACVIEKVPTSYLTSAFTAPLLIFWRFWIYLSSLKGAGKWR